MSRTVVQDIDYAQGMVWAVQTYIKKKEELTQHDAEMFHGFKKGLNLGLWRAAEPDLKSATGWRVNPWVKQGILIGMRLGELIEIPSSFPDQPFIDKHTWPLQGLTADRKIRLIPGGSSIRDGCFVGAGVVCVPPMYINCGAYVDRGTMVDSHALVGSCAQVGKNCHISAGAQIGGVLEPVGAMPVIVEDEVFIGGLCGVFEGTIVKKRAILAPGVILTAGVSVYDTVKQQIYTASTDSPLVIPEGAVVVPGSRLIDPNEWTSNHHLALYIPIIIKYRDANTDRAVTLEDALRCHL